jgi:uncharacterized membrane protein
VRRRDTATLTAAAALALSFAPTLMRRGRRAQLAISAGSVVLGGLAGAATEGLVLRLARELDGGEPAARGVLVGAGALSVLTELPRDPHPAVALAGQVARVSGICALLGSIAPEREAVPLDDPRKLGALAAAGLAAVVGWQRLDKRSRPRRARVQIYPPERDLHTVGGVRADFEGTRFLGTAPAAQDIGPGAMDPIRVFVGVHAAEEVGERARLAVDELERLGAFERARIVVCSATLRGYVNPIPVAAEEHLSGGDVASVTIQYFDRRTLLMPLKVGIAARTHRALLEELRRRTPAGVEICVYGESLGAWASQNVFRAGGVRALDEARVARALWIGTPYFSRLPRLLASGAIPGDERVASVSVADIASGDVPLNPRFVFVSRRTDPVVLFRGLDLIWRRPDWLPPGSWTPGVTFLQLAFDLVAATNWPAAVPQALAHDYRLEGPAAVNLAFGHGADRERLAALADRLVAEEVERGARIRALKRSGGYTPGH